MCVYACVVRLITREQLNQTNLANLDVCKVIRTAAVAIVLYYCCNRYNNTTDFSGGCLAWNYCKWVSSCLYRSSRVNTLIYMFRFASSKSVFSFLIFLLHRYHYKPCTRNQLKLLIVTWHKHFPLQSNFVYELIDYREPFWSLCENQEGLYIDFT